MTKLVPRPFKRIFKLQSNNKRLETIVFFFVLSGARLDLHEGVIAKNHNDLMNSTTAYEDIAWANDIYTLSKSEGILNISKQDEIRYNTIVRKYNLYLG
jgi:hypothetical protein